ncbi:hypothetical protein BGZ83_002237 [Gryganskiella cystojenkinii]|nr:hypothetical protein BGZ83_002237 [Gryganskiella cystojenkinii]
MPLSKNTKSSKRPRTIPSNLPQVIRLINPRVVKFEKSRKLTVGPKTLRDVADDLSNLQVLTATDVAFPVSDLVYLLNTSRQLSSLRIRLCELTGSKGLFSDSTAVKSGGRRRCLPLPNLKSLVLEKNFGSGLPRIMDFLTHCPQLESLTFRFNCVLLKKSTGTAQTHGDLSQFKACPNLTKLTLDHMHISEMDMTQILAHCPGLTHLACIDLPLTGPAFESLTRLLCQMTVLELSFSIITPWQINRIFQSAPKLVKLILPDVEIEALFEGPLVFSQQTKMDRIDRWVCLDLQVLWIQNLQISESRRRNRWITGQMARLKKLEVLSIGPTSRDFSVLEDDIDDKEVEDLPFHLEENDKDNALDFDDGDGDWLTNLYSSHNIGKFERSKMQKNSELRWIARTWPKLRLYKYIDSDEDSDYSDSASNSDEDSAGDLQ